jgi:hypothetical protein
MTFNFDFQALTIALASDFVPHLVYMYGYAGISNYTLKGFVNFTLTRTFGFEQTYFC